MRWKKRPERSVERNEKEVPKPSDKRDGWDIPPPLVLLLKSMQEMDRKPPVTLALMGWQWNLFLKLYKCIEMAH